LTVKPAYRDAEWQIIFAAYAYEFDDAPLMDDRLFDLLCNSIREPFNIPDFDPATGMWIQDVVKIVGHDFLKSATARLRAMRATSPTHIKFPRGWVLPQL